ncbi:MAG: glycosyltransferase [Ignavibacteria bacterium]|nr:glycosyltransferase [Ignavibacteria bacterium]
MSALHVLIIFLAVYYCVVVLGLCVGLRRIRYKKSDIRPFVSVIVAARNEERTIGTLLIQLTRQTYPSYEIIVVNDRSTDRTREIIESFQRSHPSVKRIDITSLDGEMPPKKNALARGIAESKGEILCFTDADCIPPLGWLAELVGAFGTGVGLVAGYSPYDPSLLSPSTRKGVLKSIFYSFLEYEEFKGAVWSAGAIGLRKGWLCTGRSLAYRKAVYDEVGGFEKIRHSISGDDDLFLQLVRRATRWNIRYVMEPGSYVRTAPPPTLRAFVQQRTRHFSASRFFPPLMKLFFFVFHSANLILFLSLVGTIILNGPSIPLWAFAAKVICDSMLFLVAAPMFSAWAFAPSFVLMEFLYIAYNTAIGPLGLFKRFEWKPERES